MNKLILATALIAASTTAYAEREIIEIKDVYTTEVVNTPTVKRSCRTVDVPVYDTYERQGSAGEAITGAIVGGVIGNQFGSGSGNDIMTVLGALIGANSADKEERYVSGYRQERRCTEDVVQNRKLMKVYSHSIMEFIEDGKRYVVEFEK